MSKRKKTTRTRLDRGVLAKETARINVFTLSELVPAERNTPMRDIFKAYRKWLVRGGIFKTELSIDSFGRLFPKSYERKVASIKGELQRVAVGVGLRK